MATTYANHDQTFWMQDPVDFFSFSNMYYFFPTSGMNLEQKLNSFLRLSMYFSTVHYLMYKNIKIFTTVIIVMIISSIYYKSIRENYIQYEENVSNDIDNRVNSKADCKIPKKNNPFMNVMMNEYRENPEREEACDVEDGKIKSVIHKQFNTGIYRDVGDVFDRKNSFRNFYTMPNTTIPNKQNDFAKWLYFDKEKTQKEGNGDRNQLFAKNY
jgi:hypothetical protein